MTNEELAAQARTGDETALLELWRQVRRLGWKVVNRWTNYARLSGLDTDDLGQIAFLGLLKAVDYFSQEIECSFSTVFVRAVKNELVAATGRTERQRADPLRYAAPLDAPASPDAPEDLTLCDLIEDPAAVEAFQHTEAFIDLEPFLSALPEVQQAALYRRYWMDLPMNGAARKAHDAAIKTLRHPSNSRRLKELLYS